MLHFTNQELANTYHVSVRTVRNWIDAAKSGKLNLVLHEEGKRTYVANTSKNIAVIQQLSEKNKKYRPLRTQRTVSPSPEFYKLYTEEQVYDLVANLEINHEIPLKYTYFGGGASYWDSYIERMSDEQSLNNLNASIELLKANEKYIDVLLSKYNQVNVIDIGIGNALPGRQFLEHLMDQNKLGRYIGIDISPKMLDIAEKNVRSWFGDKIRFEKYAADINQERFGNILADEYTKSDSKTTCNILLFFGGTLQNFRKADSPLSTIHDSMGTNDFLIHQQKLDTPSSRRYFDFHLDPKSTSLAPNHRMIFDLFNIDESFYDIEMGFDTKLSERYIRVVFNLSLAIKFEFKAGQRILNFNKGDVILLWRARQNSLLEVLGSLISNDLYPLQASQTSDQEYLLTISQIMRDQ